MERCPKIAKMYQRHVSDDICLAEFATKLGLIAVTDLEPKKRYKMRKRGPRICVSTESDNKENRTNSESNIASTKHKGRNDFDTRRTGQKLSGSTSLNKGQLTQAGKPTIQRKGKCVSLVLSSATSDSNSDSAFESRSMLKKSKPSEEDSKKANAQKMRVDHKPDNNYLDSNDSSKVKTLVTQKSNGINSQASRKIRGQKRPMNRKASEHGSGNLSKNESGVTQKTNDEGRANKNTKQKLPVNYNPSENDSDSDNSSEVESRVTRNSGKVESRIDTKQPSTKQSEMNKKKGEQNVNCNQNDSDSSEFKSQVTRKSTTVESKVHQKSNRKPGEQEPRVTKKPVIGDSRATDKPSTSGEHQSQDNRSEAQRTKTTAVPKKR